MKNTQKWILRLSITIALCKGLGSALVHAQIKSNQIKASNLVLLCLQVSTSE